MSPSKKWRRASVIQPSMPCSPIPASEWVFTDGRAYILRSGKQFDVIEADALRPNSAYSGNLYSCEYFRTLKARLKPGGLAVTWAPTDRVLASFLEVFPYALVVDGIALGSGQPIGVDRETIVRRLADPFTIDYYQRIGADLRPLVANLLAGRFIQQTPEVKRPARLDLNSDLYPETNTWCRLRSPTADPGSSKSIPSNERD